MTETQQHYVSQWEELDAMCEAGRGETDEADALRDEMDPFWRDATTADVRAVHAAIGALLDEREHTKG